MHLYKQWPTARSLSTRVAVRYSTASQLLHDIYQRYEYDKGGALDCLNYVIEDSIYDNWPARLAQYVQEHPPVEIREWSMAVQDYN